MNAELLKTQTGEPDVPPIGLLGNREKGTHKKETGEPLPDSEIRRMMLELHLVPNIVTGKKIAEAAGQPLDITAQRDSWNLKGVLYQPVKDPEKYEDVITVTITDNKVTKEEYYIPFSTLKPDKWTFPNGRERVTSDMIPIPASEKKDKTQKKTYQPHVGVELEVIGTKRLGSDPKKETDGPQYHEISDDLKKVLDENGNAKITAEYLKGTTEVAFGHTNNLAEGAADDLRVLQGLQDEADKRRGFKKDLRFLPVSAFPLILGEGHSNPDSYVRGFIDIVHEENMRVYGTSHCLQITVENLNPERGRRSQDAWNQVTHLVKALTLDSPVAYGEIEPNMKNIMENFRQTGTVVNAAQFLEDADFDEPLSIREAARLFGSTLGGGVSKGPFPVPTEDYWGAVEEAIIKEQTPTADRIGGNGEIMHHGNMRYRRGTGENSANEISSTDTVGGDPIKITALKEFVARLNIVFNIMTPEQLAEEKPSLFKSSYTSDDAIRLQKAHLQIDNEGMDAVVEGADGKPYKAEDLFKSLLSLVSGEIKDDIAGVDLPPMPNNILIELQKSAMIPTEKDFRNAKGTETEIDSQGQEVVVPSIAGWYGEQGDGSRGIGTPAHWRRARIKALQQLGYTKEQILADYIEDGIKAYDDRLTHLKVAHIENQYALAA